MRARRAATCLLLAQAVTGCRAAAGSGEDASVYVPPPVEDAGADVGATGFGLGQVDRAGRPLVAVLLVGESHQDEYNAQASFDLPAPRDVLDALTARLHALDTLSLDGGLDPVDWPVDGGAHPLVPLFSTDVLLVDTGLSCVAKGGGFAGSYLDLEREIFLGGPAHSTCGGRVPNDDVVGKTLTLLVTADRIPVGQGAAAPTKPAAMTFPYLADPN